MLLDTFVSRPRAGSSLTSGASKKAGLTWTKGWNSVSVCRGHDVLREMMLIWVCQGLSQWGAPPILQFDAI